MTHCPLCRPGVALLARQARAQLNILIPRLFEHLISLLGGCGVTGGGRSFEPTERKLFATSALSDAQCVHVCAECSLWSHPAPRTRLRGDTRSPHTPAGLDPTVTQDLKDATLALVRDALAVSEGGWTPLEGRSRVGTTANVHLVGGPATCHTIQHPSHLQLTPAPLDPVRVPLCPMNADTGPATAARPL